MQLFFQKQEWEKAFEDWEKLLKRAKAEELLQDPKAIWDEAWRQATMISWGIVDAKAPPTHRQEILDAIKVRLLK